MDIFAGVSVLFAFTTILKFKLPRSFLKYIYIYIYLFILIWKVIISQLRSVSLFTTASNN